MPTRYRPLLPTTAQDAEREMEDAFESDVEDDDANSVHESTPLTDRGSAGGHTASPGASPNVLRRPTTVTMPGAYDFEREYEYDYPPPGSPPRPSARALPNDIGNSNGILPSSPVRPSAPRRSVLSRIRGAVLSRKYTPLPTEVGASRVIGGGLENDGVFANVTAKPQAGRVVRSDDGEVHVMPEDNQKEVPPSYAEAQADAVPPYWETTVHAPITMEPGADMIIEDLPTGSFFIFCISAFISFFFQFVGFLLTYLLHTSHAAKYGSRAGLGLTLIQLGFYSRTMGSEDGDVTNPASPTASNGIWPVSANITAGPSSTAAPMPDDAILSVSSRDWLSFFFMTLGWFLVLSSVVGFWRIKRWESALRSPPAPPTLADIERDRAIRRNIEHVFGIAFGDDDERGPSTSSDVASEARLTRDLRAAGLL